VDLLASKVDALAQCFDRLGTPPPGSLVRGPSGAMFEVGAFYEICGIHGHVAAKCQSTFPDVEFANAMQNYGQRPQITPSQTHITPVREITQISPIATTIPCHPILPNHNLPVSNTGLPTPHLHNNSHPSQNPIRRVLWSAS